MTCGLLAIALLPAAAMPVESAEPVARLAPAIVTSKSRTLVAADLPEPVATAVADEFGPPPRAVSARKRVKRPAADLNARGATDAARSNQLSSREPGRARILQANFDNEAVSEPIPELASDTVSDTAAETFPEAAPDRGRQVRPFRKMAEILPYDNYEPDAETAAKDRCMNLCPRPDSGECEACTEAEADADGRVSEGRVCPDCPYEEPLRRLGRTPGEPDSTFIPRNFAHMYFCWEPTNLYHNPIYFEDVPLERYGHTRHYLIQPFFSGAKFAVQFFGLPYQLALKSPCNREYSLGYYRPGEFAPYKYYQIPWNTQAALVEAGVITGGYFLFAPGVGP